MDFTFSQLIKLFKESANFSLLKGSRHGFEREALRVTERGDIAMTVHPKSWGSALKNPYITTDFSEAQPEFVTPAFKSQNNTLKFLDNLYTFANHSLKNEFLWPANMPCRLPKETKIPIADYGNSNQAKRKVLYRLGLSHRYSRTMQTVSGTHYNFSFSEDFWKFLHKKFAPKEDFQKFVSEGYLRLVRNFLRYGWLNTYLFGASPAIDKSYLKKKHPALSSLYKNTYYGQYATSLRLSEIGYYSKGQAQLAISFNDFDSYVKDLEYAISTPNPAYKNLPGLNSNLLQIEAEHYSRIRPKQIPKGKESVIDALKNRGILYVEARSVDIDPYCPTGICCDQLNFLHAFLIYCFFKESPKISDNEKKEITGNQNKVALYGRKPKLKLFKNGREIYMKDWAIEMLDELCEIGDKGIIAKQLDKVHNASLTPSGEIINDMKARKEDFNEFALRLAKQHKKYFLRKKLAKKVKTGFEHIAQKSLQDQKNQEIIDEALLEGYEDMEVSTQILIREAFKRAVKVEIIDRKENFIRLSKGRKIEFVKQATKTSKDSLMTYLLMENKLLSKFVLDENGINTPKGGHYATIAEALDDYPKYKDLKIVVKPKNTNYGIGVSFVEKRNPKNFEKSVRQAFKHDNSILVEEFIEGKEYRFLVLGYKTVAILNRIPANIVGDGAHSIRELVKIKNEDPRYYKFFNTYTIKTGKEETKYLADQKLSWESVPKNGQRIFLRSNSNVSTGGDPIDYTDEMHKSYKAIAERAAKSVQAKFCGVDMIVKNIHQTANKSNHSIIEINFNPALQMHEFPVEGKKRNTAKVVLDILGF